jgi:hypothetical protein
MLGTAVLAAMDETRELVYRCCYCGRVRTQEGDWQQASQYPPEPVSHGICRSCFVVHHPDIPPPPETR